MSTNAIPLATQVGGHAGVLTSEDGSLVIKPALARELEFYQKSATDPAFDALAPFIPRFFGTLKLEGKLDESVQVEGSIAVTPVESIVIENLSHTFVHPNILDIKLGTVLWDDTASEEKRARMVETAKNTTSFEKGVRMTGFQVYDHTEGKAINTPKSYGKSIKASELLEGFAKFFPVAPSTAEVSGAGLPKETLLSVLAGIREDVVDIRAAFSELEMRMVGGSVLIVYEADHVRALEGIKNLGLEGEDEVEDEEDDEDEEKNVGPPFVVKMIDFAHTKLVPGEGPDLGVLKGLDTVLELLDGRIAEVKA